MKKKNFGGGGWGGGGGPVWVWGSDGGQGGCEWRSEGFVKIQKKNIFFGGGGVRSGGGGGGGGVRVDVSGEVKLL